MAMMADVKRLYVGGLSPSISQKDLKDRFGKFGEVSDVEIITRQDAAGTPLKTFGYININISDAGLKKCMTVLNNSRWKGGTLQIEVAKESFLHRLAEERQQATMKSQTPKVELKETLMDSFKKVGVENFHMKSAVPGTEIPGHKNWVVSKFGRVLPVLHLKNQVKKKVVKYDPSKHCHNLRRLESEMTLTPVSKLTWEILDGDTEISKKRRGEFSPQEGPRTKIRKNSRCGIAKGLDSETLLGSRYKEERQRRSESCGDVQVLQGFPEKVGSAAAKKQHSAREKWSSHLRVSDDDVDSEDEIKMLVTSENAPNLEFSLENEDDLEVVANDFGHTSNIFWASGSKREAKHSEESGNELDYDSADTDEILSKLRGSAGQETAEVVNGVETLKEEKGASKPSSKVSPGSLGPSKESSCIEGPEEESDENEDSDYEAVMANCYRLELSLADLEKLAQKPSENDCRQISSRAESGRSSEETSPREAKLLATKTGNTPDAILAAILADNRSDEKSNRNKQKSKKKISSQSLPAFVGTKSLMALTGGTEPSLGLKRKIRQDLVTSESDSQPTPESSSASSASEKQGRQIRTLPKEPKAKAVSLKAASFRDDTATKRENGISSESKEMICDTSSLEEAEGLSETPKYQRGMKTELNDATTGGSQPNKSDVCDSASGASKNSKRGIKRALLPETPEPPSVPPLGPGRTWTFEKQQLDNQKRLAALELKQDVAKQQKQLIQSALSRLDTPGLGKGKRIVFHSDDESTEEELSDSETRAPTKTLFEDSVESSTGSPDGVIGKEFQKQGGSKLFLSSEDEDEEEDCQRFQIRPQFEGKTGQKLMELQSRFGTDERFRMDSRFLESEEEVDEADQKSRDGLEEQLEDEKKKNLNILQSILQVDLQASESCKESAKSKTFRDVSALHYDPSREEHAAFETKREEPQKESKAARRKKREAAEKLPDVSRDIFYNVAVELREAFGATRGSTDQNAAVAWDKEREVDVRAEDEKESTGFKFSFFGDDLVEDATVKDDYKVELIKGARVPWQADPRFQDSSSEEEEEEEELEDQSQQQANSNKGSIQPKKTFFFFFQDDARLKEGPKMFCRMGKLEDQREKWEETRSLLIEEYRKKHKNAKRRVKLSWKS